MFKKSVLVSVVGIGLMLTSGCAWCGANGTAWGSLPPLQNPEQTAKVLSQQAPNLNPKVLRLALNAYNQGRQKGYDCRQVLTVIDYSKPSNQQRFWVFDLKQQKLLYSELVAHGRNSGDLTATRFSNTQDSLESSIGVFATGAPYVGKYGYALRLNGLEPGFNDNALKRAIVVHGAWYVTPDFVRQHGEAGRSWGCPALNPAVVKNVIKSMANGTLVVAYYPDRNWLSHSRYVGGAKQGLTWGIFS